MCQIDRHSPTGRRKWTNCSSLVSDDLFLKVYPAELLRIGRECVAWGRGTGSGSGGGAGGASEAECSSPERHSSGPEV